MKRYALRAGEYLAIDPSHVRHDADGFYFMLGPEPPDNEHRGTVCIVHVRGALTQFKGDGGDSYEAIIERTQAGINADPKPSVIIFHHSSPGGVVAGLNECVFKLQRMSAASGIEFVSFVGEMAASADFAICCASKLILAPPSAVVGSIGCISTMVSCAEMDRKDGLDFRLITSGKRKADGHPHAPISDDAVKAETARNTELAAQFFEIASKARGIPVKKIAALEAAIYLGREAERVGLIDEVIGFDEAVYGLDQTETPPPNPVAPNNGNVTDRRARDVPLDKPSGTRSSLAHTEPQNGTPREAHMLVKLAALIKKTEAAIATATDPKERRSLQAKLAAFAATRAEMDDGDEGDDKKDDDDDDGKAKKAAAAADKAKKTAEAAKHRAKAAEHKAKAAECEDAAKAAEADDEASEESEAEASARIAAIHARIEGTAPAATLAPGAAAAIASQATETRAAMARIERLEKDAETRNLTAMIAEASAQRRITPGEAKTLAKKDAKFVKDFLEMRPKALVATTEENLEQPDGTPAGDIAANVKAIVEQSVTAAGLTGEKADKFREESYAAQRKAASNGAGVTH